MRRRSLRVRVVRIALLETAAAVTPGPENHETHEEYERHEKRLISPTHYNRTFCAADANELRYTGGSGNVTWNRDC